MLNNTLARGAAFLEKIKAINLTQRAISPAFNEQKELIDYHSDYLTKLDGKRRHSYKWAIELKNEGGATWQFIVESEKTAKGYHYLAPRKNGNRAYFPAIPSEIRELIGNRYGVNIPSDGSFWDWIAKNKQIPILITEGAGKAESALSHGFVAIAVYGCSCLASPDLKPFIKRRDIMIALDSDEKESARKAVKRALRKHLRALAREAKSVSVLQWDSNYKGLDDLLAARGVDALIGAISRSVSHIKYLGDDATSKAAAALTDAKIKADLVLDALPTPAELAALFTDHRDIFLVAPKGLGKSELAGELLKMADKALLPTSIESLAVLAAGRFEGVNYRTELDFKGNTAYSSEGYADKISFCIESIQAIAKVANSLLNEGAFIFNDELDLSLESLATSDTHAKNGNRAKNERLFWDCQIRGGSTLSVSADLSEYEAALWERKTGRKPFVVRVITAKKQSPVRLYQDDLTLLYELQSAIKSGDRVMVCCSSKNYAHFLEYVTGADFCLTRDTANDAKFKGLRENPNQWLKENAPNILIVSPVLRSGFSITHNAFDKVFCFYHASSIPASTALQLAERYRLPAPRFIYAQSSSNKPNGIYPDQLVKARRGKAFAHDAITKSDKKDIYLVDETAPYYHYKARGNWSRYHFYGDIAARIQDEYDAHFISYDYQKVADRKVYSQLKKDFEAYKNKLILEARNLTESEYKLYKDSHSLTGEQNREVSKYAIADWSDTKPESLTESLIERDNFGKKRRALERFEMVLNPDLAEILDASSRATHEVQQDFSYLSIRTKAILQLEGVTDFLEYALSGGDWYIRDDETGNELAIKAARSLAKELNHAVPMIDKNGKPYCIFEDRLALVGINLPCGKNASLAAVLGAFLSWLGLERGFTQRSIDGARVRIYTLDSADLALVRGELERREKRRIREGYAPKDCQLKRVFFAAQTPPNINIKGSVQVDDKHIPIPVIPTIDDEKPDYESEFLEEIDD